MAQSLIKWFDGLENASLAIGIDPETLAAWANGTPPSEMGLRRLNSHYKIKRTEVAQTMENVLEKQFLLKQKEIAGAMGVTGVSRLGQGLHGVNEEHFRKLERLFEVTLFRCLIGYFKSVAPQLPFVCSLQGEQGISPLEKKFAERARDKVAKDSIDSIDKKNRLEAVLFVFSATLGSNAPAHFYSGTISQREVMAILVNSDLENVHKTDALLKELSGHAQREIKKAMARAWKKKQP